jgi:hypothetical protein
MLVWLASYPRSGNHLLRTILHRCFDLGSYEIYQKIARPLEPAVSAIVGERRFEEEGIDAFVSRARSSSDLFLVKTHDPVPDSDSCIYVVRDARAVLVSYQRYLADVESRSRTLPELIAGNQWPGKWQVHVKRFLARDSGNTLILRYEDLAACNPPLGAIGGFLDRKPIRPFDISFDDLRDFSPMIFPTGNNLAGIDRIERDHRWLFWKSCGEMMHALGYGPPAAGKPREAIRAFFHDPAKYTGAILWPTLRSRLPRL